MVKVGTKDQGRQDERMKADNFHLEDYVRRIGFRGAPKADLATLTGLMQAQLRAVPFENLDVQAGKAISIRPEDVVAKIVPMEGALGRGGYCYEVNGLFALALEAIGIPNRLLAARPSVHPRRGPRTHMIIAAEVEGATWLCDTGFGSFGLRAPLDLAVFDTDIVQDHDHFRLTLDDRGDHVLEAMARRFWVPQYSFNLSPFELTDFIPANHYNATHPDSIFVQKRLLVRQTATGRHVLNGDHLKTYEDGVMTERVLAGDDLRKAVRTLFGLEL